jgi:glycosyltransferase involved in cell wall biosynthesis
MRVVMVAESATGYVAELSGAIARLHHDVTVYQRIDDSGWQRGLVPAGYDLVQLPEAPARRQTNGGWLPHLGVFARLLSQRLREGPPPDVVHAHYWTSGLVAALACRGMPVPVLHSFHGLGVVAHRHLGDTPLTSKQRVGVETTVSKTSACILTSSNEEQLELVKLGVQRSRIAMVPRGVDVNHFRPEGPKLTKTRPHRIVAAGALQPHKGFTDLVTARPSLPDTELVIAGGPESTRLGEDPHARRLLELAAELGVADRVLLTGQVGRQQMPQLLRSADVVACAPWFDAFGTVALEAMGCGRPVVATAVGGLADAVVDGVTGSHVAPRKPRALSAALRELLGDPAWRSALGIAGRDRAVSRYSWDRVAMDVTRAYEQCSMEVRRRSVGAR